MTEKGLSDSVLAETIREAFKAWDSQKALGATVAERVANLAKTLRASWPFVREWKYLCGECHDYGLRIYDCDGDATCGRPRPHLPHDYGVACWCTNGGRFRVKVRTEEGAVEAAAKVRKPTRFGR